MEMKEQEYMTQRVDDQLNWLEKKSAFNQKRYKLTKAVVIVASVSIPFLAGLIDENASLMKYAIAFSGFIISIAEGFAALNKYHENWVQYRVTAEALKREKIMYLTQSGAYKESAEAFKTFVVQVEGILANENAKWEEVISQKVDVPGAKDDVPSS